jgi:L-threonylcarbamoyladenylate synthase
VAFPTETVYGLGADAENQAAVARVFAVKGRPSTHPLIVHLSGVERLADWAVQVPDLGWTLARQFWPGPLTLVLRRHPRIAPLVTGGQDTIALRVPDHPLALDLLRHFGGGIAGPSANRFGAVSPTTAEHVRADLGDAVDYILDGGACRIGLESTILDLSSGEPTVLRPGGIPVEALQEATGRALSVQSNSAVRVPGHYPSHYAPKARVLLLAPSDVPGRVHTLSAHGHKVGVLSLSPETRPLRAAHHILLPTVVEQAAPLFYAALRQLDAAGCDVIITSLPPAHGLGLALADRLRRAAGPSAACAGGTCDPQA